MTPQQLKAMKLALEAMKAMAEDLGYFTEEVPAITALEEALADYAMREVQRLGQEIEPDDIASILACRDMLDAQPVPPRTWVGLTDEQANEYNYLGPDMPWVVQEVAAILKEKNT